MKVSIGPYRKNRSVKVHIDEYDTWNADHTLALIIKPILEEIKQRKHGIPYVKPEDAMHIGEGNRNEYHMFDDLSEQRWEWVLDEMIWAFDQILKGDDPDQFYFPYQPDEPIEHTIVFETDQKGQCKQRNLMSDDQARKLGKYDPERAKAYHDRVENGLILFGKYFRALWT